MSGHGQKISRTQEKAIAALLASTSIPAAARMIGIAESTLSRWLKVDSFQAAYRKARKQVVSLAVTQVQAAMTDAVDTLKAVMNDAGAPASARVAAARTVLDLGIRAVEVEDFEVRIQNLEMIIEGK